MQWLPELQIGWFPVSKQPYDAAYWERYRGYDQTTTGEVLTAMRMALVAEHWTGDVIDIGIGGGRFVRDRPRTFGFDVNPCAVAWLRARSRWLDPYRRAVRAVTFWDSLEHIHNPAPLLANVREWIFASLPIFADCADVLRSKHYRRDEHCWYFTRSGFELFMGWFGFEKVAHNDMEQSAGREQIETFVFRRIWP